jgi:carbamate kinase
MGPKIVSAIRFLEKGGQKVIITTPENLEDALEGKKGTCIVPG